MTCKDCKHFQETQLKYSDGQPVYDCPYADDWCEEDAARALNKKDKSNICRAARKGCKAYNSYWKYKIDK